MYFVVSQFTPLGYFVVKFIHHIHKEIYDFLLLFVYVLYTFAPLGLYYLYMFAYVLSCDNFHY